MAQIQGLSLDDKIIGLRFKTPQGVFDADRESLRNLGLHNLKVPQISMLRPFGNLLMTQEEFDTNLHTEDISDSPKLAELVAILKASQPHQYMFSFLKPYEQDVEEFLISGWLPEYNQRNDEHNGQHNLYLPDGSRYRGGWVGKGRTYEIVLRKFHYEQCYWYMHRGGTPNPDAIKTYNDLKRYNDIISDIKQKIKVRTEENGQNKVVTAIVPLVNTEQLLSNDKKQLLLNDDEFLRLAPYQRRGFFNLADYAYFGYQSNKLNIPSPPKLIKDHYSFDLRELTVIAYLRKFYEAHNNQPELGHLK